MINNKQKIKIKQKLNNLDQTINNLIKKKNNF